MVQLLAPAGSLEALIAAIDSGADAVYFGTKQFNARIKAKNFMDKDLQDGIDYCHAHGARAFITLNTILFDTELEAADKTISLVYCMGADALIVQDLAAAQIAKVVAPELRVHASTQMTIHNSLGARAALKLGFKRINLARELSLEQIRAIHSKVPEIELETFVHGSMCVSYSGLCLISQDRAKRSGNRGVCSQFCRLPLGLEVNEKTSRNGYLLNMKDLNSLELLEEIISAGVSALKIEGRMKNSHYVGKVVSAYRRALDGKTPKLDRDIFNREFTDGFYRETNNSAKGINYSKPGYKGELIGKVTKVSASKVTINLFAELSVNDGIRSQRQNKATRVRQIYRDGKPVRTANKECQLKVPGMFVGDTIYRAYPASTVNLRDKAYKTLDKVQDYNRIRRKSADELFSAPQFFPLMQGAKLFRIRNEEQLAIVSPGAFAALEAWRINTETIKLAEDKGIKLVVDTPTIIPEERVEEFLSRLKQAEELGIRNILANNLGTAGLPNPKFLGYHLNVANRTAAAGYSQFGNIIGIVGSLELPRNMVLNNSFMPMVHGRAELMVLEHDLINALEIPEQTFELPVLTDNKKNRFGIAKGSNVVTMILSPYLIENKENLENLENGYYDYWYG